MKAFVVPLDKVVRVLERCDQKFHPDLAGKSMPFYAEEEEAEERGRSSAQDELEGKPRASQQSIMMLFGP